MGLSMFLKGRMGILPHNIKNREQVKEIFEKMDKEKIKTWEGETEHI